jgi:hypothetical protein
MRTGGPIAPARSWDRPPLQAQSRSKNGTIAATLFPTDVEMQHFPAASEIISNTETNLLI